jgi:hypothetical protein
VRQYIGGPMSPAPLLLADQTQKMYRNVRILSRQDKKNKKRRTEQFGALRLFSSQSPINLALQTGNRKTLQKRRRVHKKNKQTSITTFRYPILSVACFLTPLLFQYPLPLKGSHRMGDGRIFSKNLRASLFNDDLSNESNFGQIHLAGQ